MTTLDTVEDILKHYGKLGMKWGVRANRVGDTAIGGLGITTTGGRERSAARKARGPQSVTVKDKRKKIKTSGGKGHPAHPDALRARRLGQVGKKSGLKSLSNQELQTYSHRLNLEQSVKRLNYNEKSAPRRFVGKILGQSGSEQAKNVTNKAATQAGSLAVRAVLAA